MKTFDQLPIVTVDESYFTDMPNYVARLAQQNGPIFKRKIPPQLWNMYGQEIVYMVGPEANKFVMHTHRDHFSHDQGWTPTIGGIFNKGLLNTDDPEHARQRKMMNPAFTMAYMNRYLPVMNRVIDERTRDWAELGVVDVYTEARKITFDVAAETLVGFRTGAQVDRLRELFYTIMRGDFDTPGMSEAQYYELLMSAQGELNQMLLNMIAERRQAPSDDILGILIQARDENGQAFGDEELLGQLHILLVAGHETSTTMSAWLFYLLATQPEYRQRILDELDTLLANTSGEINLEEIKAMKVLGNALDEAGRLYPPVGTVPRGVVKDYEFGGYQVPAGTRVFLSLAGCHRLPEVFENPNKFDPDRFAPPREEDKRTPYSLVTFGGGPRICIGINFAQVEVKALAAHLLHRYTFDLVPGQQCINAYYSPVATVLGGIKLAVKPRK